MDKMVQTNWYGQNVMLLMYRCQTSHWISILLIWYDTYYLFCLGKLNYHCSVRVWPSRFYYVRGIQFNFIKTNISLRCLIFRPHKGHLNWSVSMCTLSRLFSSVTLSATPRPQSGIIPELTELIIIDTGIFQKTTQQNVLVTCAITPAVTDSPPVRAWDSVFSHI